MKVVVHLIGYIDFCLGDVVLKSAAQSVKDRSNVPFSF